MGYDAYIRCNCYKEGKIEKPYFSAYLVENIDGFKLNLPKNILDNKNLIEKIEEDFYNWVYNGCEHEDMEYYNCRISNAGGMGWLVGAIEYINKFEKIPLLMGYIKDCNGGYLSYESIHEFKNEIDIFSKHGGIPIYEFKYVRKENDGEIWSTVSYDMEDHKNILFSENNIELSLNNGYFNIVENTNLVFQANNFLVYNQDNNYSYIDVITSKKYTCKYVFDNKCFNKHKKNFFYFEKNPEYFLSIFDSFSKTFYDLINASIKTKNPIIWC
jgi:hypothetical protein